jgi:Holliday junction resolvase RusA-like endonuclease
MTALQILVPVVIGAPPKPKGSLRHVGRNRMVEQVKGSGTWRETVALYARQAATQQHWPTTKDPVHVGINIYLPTNGSKNALPTGHNTGDVDKHARNVLDALADAGIYTDDSQVVALSILKLYASQDTEHAATITVERFQVVMEP